MVVPSITAAVWELAMIDLKEVALPASHLMFEQFQVVVVGSSKGSSVGMLLLSLQLASLCSLQILPQHSPHRTMLLQAVLQTQHSCSKDELLLYT